MLDLAVITAESFTSFVGQTFEVVFADGRLPLTLAEVRPFVAAQPGAARDPFTLTFHGASNLRLPQRIYRLEHPDFGTTDIFLVQVAANENAARFEAVFA